VWGGVLGLLLLVRVAAWAGRPASRQVEVTR